MAIVKTITANGSKGHHKFTLTVTEASTNASSNESYLEYSFTIGAVNTGWNWYGWGSSIKYTININGVTFNGNISDYDGYSTVTLKTGNNIPVVHNTDGAKSISISFSVTDGANQSYTCGNSSKSDTMVLSTLHKKPTVTGVTITETNTNLTGVTDKWILGLSKKKFVINVTKDKTDDNYKIMYYGLFQNDKELVGTGFPSTEYQEQTNEFTIDTSQVTVNVKDNKVSLVVKVIDWSNAITDYPIEITDYAQYFKPSFIPTSTNVARNGQTSGKVNLNSIGQWFNGTIGTVANTLTIKYKYWVKDGTEPSTFNKTVSTVTKSGNGFTISNYELGTDFNFLNAYNVKLQVTDKFYSTTLTKTVVSGKPVWTEYKDHVDFSALTVDKLSIVDMGDGYVKFYNGLLVCYGSNTNSATTWTKDNTIYYLRGLSFGNFGETFIEKPTMIISCSSVSANTRHVVISGNNDETTTSAGTYNLSNYWQDNSLIVKANYLAIGKWK